MPKVLNNIELGVQSYCFREFSNQEIVDGLKSLGIGAIELCSRHLDAADSSQVDEVLGLYRDNGITVNSFGINRFPNDENKVRPIFEFAKKAGVSILGANPDQDSYDLMGSLCHEYGVQLAIHNHGRKDKRYGTVEQLDNALQSAGDWLGLCVDTGWFIDVGVNPVEFVRQFGSRVYGVHLKDFTYDETGERHEAVLGSGSLDVLEFCKALNDIRFNGYISIEYEGHPDNPAPSIRQCIAALEQA
jgi:sugar phosphate isomerase/epimerase